MTPTKAEPQPPKRGPIRRILDWFEAGLCSPGRVFRAGVLLCVLVGVAALLIRSFHDPAKSVGDVWNAFWNDDFNIVSVVAAFVLGLLAVAESALRGRAQKREALATEAKLAATRQETLCFYQKERIRILEGFEPPSSAQVFHDDLSIYTSIIQTLQRLKALKPQIDASGQRHDVCLLLCSPALDYLRKEYSSDINVFKAKWGTEFLDLLRELLACKPLHFDVCHLPLGSQTGINTMHDFLSGLANYLADCSDTFKQRFDALQNRTNQFQIEVTGWASNKDTCDRFKYRQHMVNIPFQIVLVNGPTMKEVVVSFAGREILEREPSEGQGGAPGGLPQVGDTRDIMGFFSSDPMVVETFHRIYLDYASPSCRAAFVPLHTQAIMHEHAKVSQKGQRIENYYFGTIPSLEVLPGAFSPAIANSTKFTTWVIDKILTTGEYSTRKHWCKRIVDIGAGTGVLVKVAHTVLRKKYKMDCEIWAIEAGDAGMENLKKNLNGVPNIKLRKWELKANDSGNGAVSGGYFEDCETKQVRNIAGDFSGFDLVIGDLPFVSARDGDKEDIRFLDPGHMKHQALLAVVSQSKLLGSGGIFITAFSTLGGPEDVASFEGYIRQRELQVVQRIDFFEADYMWMVYVIMRKDDFAAGGKNFWWERLGGGKVHLIDPQPEQKPTAAIATQVANP